MKHCEKDANNVLLILEKVDAARVALNDHPDVQGWPGLNDHLGKLEGFNLDALKACTSSGARASCDWLWRDEAGRKWVFVEFKDFSSLDETSLKLWLTAPNRWCTLKLKFPESLILAGRSFGPQAISSWCQRDRLVWILVYRAGSWRKIHARAQLTTIIHRQADIAQTLVLSWNAFLDWLTRNTPPKASINDYEAFTMQSERPKP